jgi:hypothetical protein
MSALLAFEVSGKFTPCRIDQGSGLELNGSRGGRTTDISHEGGSTCQSSLYREFAMSSRPLIGIPLEMIS